MHEAAGFSQVVNSFGLLRAPWNNDPTPFMTRHDHVYGFYNNLEPRGCDGYAKCLEFNTWSAVATCLNTDAHGHVHELIGGSWNHRSHRAKLEEDEAEFHAYGEPTDGGWNVDFCPSFCDLFE